VKGYSYVKSNKETLSSLIGKEKKDSLLSKRFGHVVPVQRGSLEYLNMTIQFLIKYNFLVMYPFQKESFFI
jgi:hypothetical protein